MSVPFNNIPAGDGIRVPLFYAEVDNSMANSATSDLRRLIVAQVNDDASAEEIGKLTICSSEEDAKRIGGTGSPLATMFSIWRLNDPMGEVWILPIQLSTGTAASCKITVTGTATEAGLLNVYVAGKLVQVNVSVGMTAAEAAAAIETAITEESDLPVKASAAEGVLTLTAKFKGTLGNDIKIEMNREGISNGQYTPAGLTVEVTAMTGGVGVPDFDEVNAALGDEAFEFIAMPYSDSTSIQAWVLVMSDESGRWSYVKQIWGHVYSCERNTFAQLVTNGKARNYQHITVVGIEQGVPSTAWDFLAAYTARQAVYISADPARPTQTGNMLGISPAKASERFSIEERNSLLKYGVATSVYAGGYQTIERAITTYQKNKSGQADNSYLDSETLHQTAYIINTLKTAITSKYSRHKLGDDGQAFDSGQPVITPKVARAELIAQYSKLERKAIVENSDKFAEALIVERDADSPNRMNVLLPPDYVNQLRVFALLNQFRLQYA